MGNYQYRSGLGNSAAYLVGGIPWITGSENMCEPGTTHRIQFPRVTRSVTIVASGSTQTVAACNNDAQTRTIDSVIRVHFTTTGSYPYNAAHPEQGPMQGQHYITLDSDEDSVTFNIKCKEIYLTNVQCDNTKTSQYQVFAELTGIHTGSFPHLTGSGVTA